MYARGYLTGLEILATLYWGTTSARRYQQLKGLT